MGFIVSQVSDIKVGMNLEQLSTKKMLPTYFDATWRFWHPHVRKGAHAAAVQPALPNSECQAAQPS